MYIYIIIYYEKGKFLRISYQIFIGINIYVINIIYFLKNSENILKLFRQ